MERDFLTDTVELRKLMAENGFNTISALSSASRINRNTLGKVLDGSIQPSADIMYKLVSALKMTPDRAGTVFFCQKLT
jgi:transcriptional regulator with XRE-family HTH domain